MKKKQYKVQWMFIGSRANDNDISEETKRLREQMSRKERTQYAKYLDKDTRPMNIILDEKKCIDMFSSKYSYYENLYFHKVLDSDRITFKSKIGQFFHNDYEASLIVYSGNAMKGTGTWHIESSDDDVVKDETIDFEDILELWKDRNRSQKHLLIIIDSNYSGHWPRKLCIAGDSSISIQSSSKYWQKSSEDREIGGFYLHNLYKIVKDRKDELIIDPKLNVQNPSFYGNFHYVYRYFDLKLKHESWTDMRKALGISTYGDWPRTSLRTWKLFKNGQDILEKKDQGLKSASKKGIASQKANPSKNSKIDIDDYSDNDEEELPYFLDKNGCRYEGNVDKEGNKEGFGVLYDKRGRLEYEGQFKNDIKNGKGIAFDSEGYQVYEGDWINGIKIGAGVNFDRNGNIIFQGEFRDDRRNGNGREIYPNGKIQWSGKYVNGYRTGKNIEYYENGTVKTEGVWKRGLLFGNTMEYYPTGILQFEGEFSEGARNGPGKQYYENGALHYEGSYSNGLFHGYGILYNIDGCRLCEGEFVNGDLQGQATTYYLNGNILYDGEFEQGKAIGVGFLRKEEGKLDYQGLREQVVREAVTAGIYKERKLTSTFEDKNVLTTGGRKYAKTVQKGDFIMDSTMKFNQNESLKQDLANSYARRVTMDDKFGTTTLSKLDGESVTRRTTYKVTNPQGANDQVAELRKSSLMVKGAVKLSDTELLPLANTKKSIQSKTSVYNEIMSKKSGKANSKGQNSKKVDQRKSAESNHINPSTQSVKDSISSLQPFSEQPINPVSNEGESRHFLPQEMEDHNFDFENNYRKTYDPDDESLYYYDRFVPTSSELEFGAGTKSVKSQQDRSDQKNGSNPFDEKLKSDLEIVPMPIHVDDDAFREHRINSVPNPVNEDEGLNHLKESKRMSEANGDIKLQAQTFSGSFKVSVEQSSQKNPSQPIIESPEEAHYVHEPSVHSEHQDSVNGQVNGNSSSQQIDVQSTHATNRSHSHVHLNESIGNQSQHHSEHFHSIQSKHSQSERQTSIEVKPESHANENIQSERQSRAPADKIPSSKHMIDPEVEIAIQQLKKQSEPHIEHVENDEDNLSHHSNSHSSLKNITNAIEPDPELAYESEESYELERVSSKFDGSSHQSNPISNRQSRQSQSSRKEMAPKRSVKAKLTIVDEDEQPQVYSLNI